jgi:predicted ester cyclase
MQPQAFAEAGAQTINRDAMAILAIRGTFAFSSGNIDDPAMIFGPNFVRHEQQFLTPEAKLENISKLIEHQREIYEVEDIQTEPIDIIVEGDKAVVRWSADVKRLPTADADDAIPARMKFEGVTISRFENGKIVEQWVYYDSKLVITLTRLRYRDFFETAPVGVK